MHKVVSRLVISFAALASLAIFTWPMFIGAQSANEAAFAQGVFIGLMPLILVMLLIEFAAGGIDSRQLALLGVLGALNAVIRLLGAGTGGIETAFFIIIIAAYVFGASFGFILGAISLLVSALLTGGVGPWLPFQMMAAGLVGLGAGLLPKLKSKFAQIASLISYAAISAFVYGALMTMWNWPFLAGVGSDISYLPGGGLLINLTRFIKYEIFTGGLIWDLGRALTTIVLIAVTAPALLATLRRAASRAGYETI
ncbi:MAG: ECF transporter S component [Rhodoluna sp.]